jgi:hypothetical protein
LGISDESLSCGNNISNIMGTITVVSSVRHLAVRLGSFDIGSNGLHILKKLSEIWLTGLGLRNDIFDLLDHILNIMNAVSDIFRLRWLREMAILGSGLHVGSNGCGVSQDSREIRISR